MCQKLDFILKNNFMTNKVRESNIELLRIILMIMIITHHVIVHSLGLNYEQSLALHDLSIYYKIFVNSFVVLGVNTFVFISGYYGMKFKIKTVISFTLQAVFYSVGIYLFFLILNHNRFEFKVFVLNFIPISKYTWWFLSLFLGLYFISPILNKGFDLLEHRSKIITLVGLVYFDSFSSFWWHSGLSGDGYSIFHFIVLYLIARYLSVMVTKIKKPLLYLILSTFILVTIAFLLLYNGKISRLSILFSYNNPILMFSSIMLFYVFKNIKIQSKFINTISGLVFGIYLLHDHESVRDFICKYISKVQTNYFGFEFLICILSAITLIFIISAFIEYIRKIVFDALLNKIEFYWENNDQIQKKKEIITHYIKRIFDLSYV